MTGEHLFGGWYNLIQWLISECGIFALKVSLDGQDIPHFEPLVYSPLNLEILDRKCLSLHLINPPECS